MIFEKLRQETIYEKYHTILTIPLLAYINEFSFINISYISVEIVQ